MSLEKDDLDRVIRTAQDISSMQRDIHHLQQATIQQNVIIQAQTANISSLTEALNKVNTTLSEATGGWKTLMWAGSIGAAMSAVIIKIASLFAGVK